MSSFAKTESRLGKKPTCNQFTTLRALTNDSNKNHEKLWAIYRDFECIPTATATEAVKQWLDEDRVVHFFLGLIYAENAESINEFCKNEKQLLETRINHQKLSLANVIGMC